MSPRKKAKHVPKVLNFCKQCAYVTNPRNLSVTGVPTLATCPFEEYAILYQRECVNGRYKPK